MRVSGKVRMRDSEKGGYFAQEVGGQSLPVAGLS